MMSDFIRSQIQFTSNFNDIFDGHRSFKWQKQVFCLAQLLLHNRQKKLKGNVMIKGWPWPNWKCGLLFLTTQTHAFLSCNSRNNGFVDISLAYLWWGVDEAMSFSLDRKNLWQFYNRVLMDLKTRILFGTPCEQNVVTQITWN